MSTDSPPTRPASAGLIDEPLPPLTRPILPPPAPPARRSVHAVAVSRRSVAPTAPSGAEPFTRGRSAWCGPFPAARASIAPVAPPAATLVVAVVVALAVVVVVALAVVLAVLL